MLKLKKKSKNSKKQSKAETPSLTLQEKLAQKRKATKARKEFTGLLTKAVSIALVAGILLAIVGGIKAAAPGVAGIIIIALCSKYPRQALFAFLVYVPLGGTITYYIGNSPILQLAKDAFYIPALISIWQLSKKRRLPLLIPQALKTPLYILLGCCTVTLLFVNGGQQFNPPPVGLLQDAPKEVPLGMGILGLKVLLGYLPLISCYYYLIRDKRDFLILSRLQVALILVSCMLGFIQYFLLLTGICEGTRNAVGSDLFKATLDARCYFGGSLVYSPSQGMIRLPGTFVAPWQWAWFLISSTFFTFATGFSDPSILWRIVGLGSLVTVFINAVISGQRIALALVPTCFVLLLLLTGQLGNLKRFIPLGMGLALIVTIAIISNPTVVQERTDSFVSRWNASPPQQFIVDQFEENWKNSKGPFGSGLGRATNAARALGQTKLVETYYPKLIYEIGILGVLAFLGLVTTLTVVCFRTYRLIKNRNYRSYAAAMWVFILFISYNTYYYPLDVDPVAVYYWFAAGILLKLPVLDRQDKEIEERIQQKSKKGFTKEGQGKKVRGKGKDFET